ncbi:MAG: AI-2E family transporter [Bacteroidaceae bacterium]|nr:AI-2E family transporter [Bacteroidaceae bacterium]MBQ9642317.1 AI-2E family transporter [Bacteroidaceae bacterium]
MKTREITFDRFIRAVMAVLMVVLVYILLRKLSRVLVPFFLAWLVAYLLYPVVCFFQYKCRLKSRVLSIVVTLLIIAGILAGACYLIMPSIIEEVGRLKGMIIDYVTTDKMVNYVSDEIELFIKHNVDFDQIANALTIKDVSSLVERGVPQVFSLLSNSVNTLVGLVASLISILYLFFILMDYEQMSHGIIHMVPPTKRGIVYAVIKDVEKGMNGYFRGQSLIALCVGILFAIGFLIIGFPLAIPLGLFIGFLNLVPYLQTLGFIPTILLALLKAYDTNENFWSILLPALLVFAVVQTIQDAILTPKIMGNVTGLNAAVILLSLSVWGSLLGFIGLIIALPLTTLLISYYKRYVLEEAKDALP